MPSVKSENLKRKSLPYLSVPPIPKPPSLLYLLGSREIQGKQKKEQCIERGEKAAEDIIDAIVGRYNRPFALLDIFAVRWQYTPDALCPLCRLRRRSEVGYRFCMFSDFSAASTSYETGAPGLYQCRSLGVMDYVVPIKARDSGIVVAAFIGGQYQQYWPDHPTVTELGEELGEYRVLKLYHDLPVLDSEAAGRIGDMLRDFSTELGTRTGGAVGIEEEDINGLSKLMAREAGRSRSYTKALSERSDELYLRSLDDECRQPAHFCAVIWDTGSDKEDTTDSEKAGQKTNNQESDGSQPECHRPLSFWGTFRKSGNGTPAQKVRLPFQCWHIPEALNEEIGLSPNGLSRTGEFYSTGSSSDGWPLVTADGENASKISQVSVPEDTVRWRLRPELVMPPSTNLGFAGRYMGGGPSETEEEDPANGPGSSKVKAVCEFAWALEAGGPPDLEKMVREIVPEAESWAKFVAQGGHSF